MMNVNYSGYKEGYGLFNFNIPVDETRTDYEIHTKQGHYYKQSTPFQHFTYDWNNDGDVYTMFGAFFDCEGRGEFFSVEDLVSLVVHDGAQIPGIHDPLQPQPLDAQISDAQQKTAPTHPQGHNPPKER